MSRPRLGGVHSRFNEEICDMLLASARAEIERVGAESEFVAVSGALEMARLKRELAEKWR